MTAGPKQRELNQPLALSLYFLGNRRELFEGGFRVVGDLLGKDVGGAGGRRSLRGSCP